MTCFKHLFCCYVCTYIGFLLKLSDVEIFTCYVCTCQCNDPLAGIPRDWACGRLNNYSVYYSHVTNGKCLIKVGSGWVSESEVCEQGGILSVK